MSSPQLEGKVVLRHALLSFDLDYGMFFYSCVNFWFFLK